MSDCRFGVSPVNYPDPDPEEMCYLRMWAKDGQTDDGGLAIL